VAAHPYFPRLRLELDKGLGWKAEVEAALERLLEVAQMQEPVGASSASNTLKALEPGDFAGECQAREG
jgi:hypothetical protein